MLREIEFKGVEKKEQSKPIQKAVQDKGKTKDSSQKPANTKKLKEEKIQSKKEESLREVLGFFINQVDEKKYQKKKPKNKKVDLQKLLQGIEVKEEIIQDEFLNQIEFAEIKGNYDDYGLGDLVLQFPNPDQPLPDQNRPVTFKEAEQIFDEVLTVMTDEGISKSQLKKERNSFLLAFLTLNDYVADQSALDKKNKKKGEAQLKKDKEDLYIKQKSLQSNDDKERSKEDLQAEGKKIKEKTSYEKYLEIQELLTKHEADLKLREEKTNFLNKQQQKGKNEAELGENQEQKEKNKQMAQLSSIDPIKELLKVTVTDVRQFKHVKKALCNGKFLVKKTYDDDDDYDWICSNSPPKDFLTLVRFTVMAKICRNGNLHTRSFIAADGVSILMVIKSNRAVIMKQAESMKITKQLELGYADLFSLEPVDESFRPLRLKNYIRDYSTDEAVKHRIEQMIEIEDDKNNDSEEEKDNADRQENMQIENRAKILYQKVLKWNAVDLRANIIKKQADVDKYMKKMSKDLNIDMSHEKVELIDDRDIGRQEWETYYIYMEYIIDFMKRMEKLQDYPEIKRNQAFLYKLIFRKAVGDSNEFWFEYHSNFLRTLLGQQDILLTLWDRLDVPPIPPYADYFNPNNESSSSMWRKYEINEKGLRSEFINMEKIKITHAIILKNINVLKLIQLKFATAYYPIHDPYQLKGISKEPFFKPLYDAGLMNEVITTQGDREIKKLFLAMRDEAESTDFDAESLEEEAQFNYKVPWHIPIDTLRDYYGEKIALYFNFLQFYTKQLWYMAIIAIVAQGTMSQSPESESRNAMIVLFSIVIIVWSTFFIEFWKREQVLFSVRFGQQNFEEDEAERPAFEGQYVRSITNDDLNEEFYSPFLRKMKMLLSLAISFIIIAMVVACVFGIFFLKDYLNTCKCVNDNRLLIDQVPAILNSIQIQIFNMIYSDLGMRFNNFENHKILSSYENSLIAKIFIFMFVNTFNSFFIIAFMNSYFESLNLCKVGNSSDCFGTLQTQMTTIFLVTFIKNIPEVVQPLIMAVIKQKSRVLDEKPVVHPFNKIDTFIEEQSLLEQYATNDEVDGTVGDYMELVIQFSFIALFGLAFPLSFLLAFITNVAEIQVDKLKLTKFSKRPFPQGASNIGNWLVILEVITFFGIFSNAGLIVYTSGSIQSNRIVTFSILLVLFLAIKYFIRFIIPDAPESAMILNKRHSYAVDRVVKGFAKSRAKQYKPAKVNLNIGGVIYDDKAQQPFAGLDGLREPNVQLMENIHLNLN